MNNGVYKCPSGETGWFGRLRKQYATFDEFERYAETYNLAARLGFADAEEAWDDNPFVHGSTDPADYGLHEFPNAYLFIEHRTSGEFWIHEIRHKQKLDLTLRVKDWIRHEFPECRLDGPVHRSQFGGEYDVCIKTDHNPPDSVIVWASGSFSIKCNF